MRMFNHFGKECGLNLLKLNTYIPGSQHRNCICTLKEKREIFICVTEDVYRNVHVNTICNSKIENNINAH